MAAQELDADGMEGAEPGHPLDRFPDHAADAQLHLARGLVGEGDGQYLVRAGAALGHEMGDARGQRLGLACTGAGKHQDGAVERFDCLALRGVEVVQPGRRPRGGRAL